MRVGPVGATRRQHRPIVRHILVIGVLRSVEVALVDGCAVGLVHVRVVRSRAGRAQGVLCARMLRRGL